MPRASTKKLHVLNRPKLRQSWSKYNLYNLWRSREPWVGKSDHETFFQQKWKAKGLLRAYHGEHIRERDWERMFKRRLMSVTSMDATYMAKHDGSEQAAGRGSGLTLQPRWEKSLDKPPIITPYMNMTFAPMERRLDIAIFRAMFASSTRQARNFCVHGKVKVNGKVMPHPSYRLNPGDMFQVDPDMVMFAAGRPKNAGGKEARKAAKAGTYGTRPKSPRRAAAAAAADEGAAENAEVEAEAPETLEQDPETTDAPEPVVPDMAPTRENIMKLVKQAKGLLAGTAHLRVKDKHALRSFIKQAKPLLTRAGRQSATPAQIVEELSAMVKELNLDGERANAAEAVSSAAPPAAGAAGAVPVPESLDDLTEQELQRLENLILQEEENPADPTKPYHTPWKPRDFLGPFAFIPRYLEVNQNVCSAIYLRHPVARRGSAEVPTPYPYPIHQLAFNWYLRRR